MIGEQIKAARKAKGVSQEELAVRLGVVRQTVSKWENGMSVPDADVLIQIAELLDVPRLRRRFSVSGAFLRRYFFGTFIGNNDG